MNHRFETIDFIFQSNLGFLIVLVATSCEAFQILQEVHQQRHLRPRSEVANHVGESSRGLGVVKGCWRVG